jgi:hypothetical protein
MSEMIAPRSLAGSCRRGRGGGPMPTRSQPRRGLDSGRAASRTRAVAGNLGGQDWARRARPTPQPTTAWQRHRASVVADAGRARSGPGPRESRLVPESLSLRFGEDGSASSDCLSKKNYHGRASRDAMDGPAGPGAAGLLRTELRVGPPGRATRAGCTTTAPSTFGPADGRCLSSEIWTRAVLTKRSLHCCVCRSHGGLCLRTSRELLRSVSLLVSPESKLHCHKVVPAGLRLGRASGPPPADIVQYSWARSNMTRGRERTSSPRTLPQREAEAEQGHR